MTTTVVSDKTKHVLVIDDDMLARMTAVQCLKQLGHTASVAEGGARALEMLRSEHFDLILLDLLMPNVDGFDVLTQLKDDVGLRGIPVIMVSAADEAESIAKCIEMGAAGHLAKPLDSAQLASEISTCLVEDGG